ncbi:MAG: murein hydrolase activator EnvC family protein [Eubacteriales bacterium]
MKANVRRKVAAGIAILLAVMMVAGVVAPFLSYNAEAAATISSLKENLSDLEEKKAQLKKDMEKINQDISTVSQRKENLDQQINVTEAEINSLNQLIDEITADIAVKEEELAQATEDAEHQYDLLCQRVRANYEAGTVNYVELLLSSESYTDFLTNMDTVTAIVEYDNDLLDQLNELKEQIAYTKQKLEEDKAEQEEARGEVEAKKVDLEGQVEESIALLQQLEHSSAEAQAQFEEYERQEEAVGAQIDKLIKEAEEAAKQQQAANGQPATGTQYTGGAFQWPCSAGGRITSPFGWRNCPFHGRELHRGMDIAGIGYGSNIVAAASGTVITAGYNSSYGNYVVINHGGGITTLYAHNSQLTVSVGQQVSKGQVIAKAGSTGNSTGVHCHFEVRENGNYVNPMGYLS